ncbi:hypothetical protein ANCCEY_03860 [Ancylostoma ceylanicum]|uniref:GPI ethanolamine phosphate transferase 2 n=1 Tax=Ancylostoma ceylanicum TaxID=53326 RepID=A0A0D6M3S6_9BILA|nr:hypothetical protein ANCCEY_03860 [Ancylostoma ceylanicum]
MCCFLWEAEAKSSSGHEGCFEKEARDYLVDPNTKVVLMVIDAWRLSFLVDPDSPMAFLRSSITSGRGVAFATTVQTPTVTMPRIKVDNNVTRHLDSKLNGDDWDVLILHYLGLDHIGHSLGGISPEMNRKLREMDSIARLVFETVSARAPILLIVMADHGMTNSGSHGGGSEAESRVPMVFLHSKVAIKRGGSLHGKSVLQAMAKVCPCCDVIAWLAEIGMKNSAIPPKLGVPQRTVQKVLRQ